MNLKQKLSETAVRIALLTNKIEEWTAIVEKCDASADVLIEAADGLLESYRFVNGWGWGNPPESFWFTKEGKPLVMAYYKAYGDEQLITINRASQITHNVTQEQANKMGAHRTFISDNFKALREDGTPKLRMFIHPYDQTNRNKRVLLSDVEALAQERKDRELREQENREARERLVAKRKQHARTIEAKKIEREKLRAEKQKIRDQARLKRMQG